MLIDFTKLIAALEGHTKALLAHAEALVSGSSETAAPRTRGRKATGEVNGVAQTVEQVAAQTTVTTAAAPGAANALTTASTAAAGAVAELPVKTVLTLQQVADAIVSLVNSPTGGRDKAVAILTKYGVKKVPELKPETFDAVMADVKAADAPAPATGTGGLF